MGHRAAVYALAPGAAPGSFLTAGGDGWVARWSVDNPEHGQLVARTEAQLFALARLDASDTFAAGNMHGGLHFLRGGTSTDVLHHRRGVYGLLVVRGVLLSVGGDGKITRWNSEGARALETLQLSTAALRSIDYSPARNELAVGSSDHRIYLLDATTLSLRQTLSNRHDNSVFCVKYHPDGRRLVSGGRDAHLAVSTLETDDFHRIPAHNFTVNALAFRPDGRILATASRDRTIKLWDAATFELLKVLETVRDDGHRNSVNDLLWMDRRLVSVSDDRTGIVWSFAE